MLNAVTIELFYRQVDELGLKFPVAAIAKATGFSKGTVSDILQRKKEPSENFIKRFSEKFSRSSTEKQDSTNIATLLQTQNALIQQLAAFSQTQNKILVELKDGIQDKVNKIETVVANNEINLGQIKDGEQIGRAHLKALLQLSVVEMARIQKRDPKDDLKRANKLVDDNLKGIRGKDSLSG